MILIKSISIFSVWKGDLGVFDLDRLKFVSRQGPPQLQLADLRLVHPEPPLKKIPRAPLFWFLIRSFAANRSLFLSTIMDSQPIASTSTLPPLPSANHERQIAIRLSTKDTAYSIPSTKFLVPSSWRRFHLSELINKVLENCEFSCLVA